MSGIEEEISSFYGALIGETFYGTYNGPFDRRDGTSIVWHTISIDYMTLSPKMNSGLMAIVKKFEGRIWKGFHNGVMYINPERHKESILSARKFKIVDFDIKCFPPWKVKEPEKYTDGCVCSFVLETVN
jgi:hypothetical protein